jgi:hypothetical protein
VAFYLLRHDPQQAELYNEVCRIGDRVRQSVACGDYWGGMGQFIDYWNGSGTWESLSEDKRAALAARAPKVALDFYTITAEDTLLSAYRSIAAPVLILRCERAPAPTQRIAELLIHATWVPPAYSAGCWAHGSTDACRVRERRRTAALASKRPAARTA